ncbi:MAG: hypothetical protein C9356_06600 [Oleiphilus sp.]|nr:MAG: hypothetical protein C9356_06600 [Oleiphilus sp.]
MTTIEASDGIKLSRRERNKQLNREAILRAGLKVFSTIGYESATISDVVKASKLSVGTFYNYYGDKDSVFAELVENLLARCKLELAEARRNATSLESFISDAFKAFATVVFEQEGMRGLIIQNTQVFRQFVFGGENIHAVFSEMEDDIRFAIEQGLLPPFPVRLAVSAMIGAGSEVFAADAANEDFGHEEKAQFLADIFIGGIRHISQKQSV